MCVYGVQWEQSCLATDCTQNSEEVGQRLLQENHVFYIFLQWKFSNSPTHPIVGGVSYPAPPDLRELRALRLS